MAESWVAHPRSVNAEMSEVGKAILKAIIIEAIDVKQVWC
jgi:hypothetical protein